MTRLRADSMAAFRNQVPFDYDYGNKEGRKLADKDKKVTIIIKNALDLDGSSMKFDVGSTGTLKHCLDAFKAMSCAVCNDISTMRFKAPLKGRLSDDTTAKALFMHHLETLSVFAFSRRAGLDCKTCKAAGYPSTNGKTISGSAPLPSTDTAQPRTLPMRFLFEQVNSTITAIRVESKQALSDALKNFCEYTKLERDLLRFSYSGEGIDEVTLLRR